MFSVKPKKPPKLYEIRKQISRFLVFVARKINPCAYSYSYYLEQITKAEIERMTYGTSHIKIEHVPLEKVKGYNDDKK